MRQPIRLRAPVPPLPKAWLTHPYEIWLVVIANALVVTGMWLRHGGMDHLGAPGGLLTAAGQVTALLGTYFALVGIVLMSRSPWLDQLFGMDGLARWHRWVGFGTLWRWLATPSSRRSATPPRHSPRSSRRGSPS